ncbi:MAG: hypothetical protein AAFP79_01360 [Pseudomonadota bacterium]
MMTQANDPKPASSASAGFLGRGPLFWFAMTLVTTAAVVALGLTEAIENEAALFILLIAPMATLIGAAMALLKANESGSGECVPKGVAQRRYIKRVAVSTSLYLASFAALTLTEGNAEIPRAARFALAVLTGLAVSGVFWAIARLIIEETDEFLRMLTIRQVLIASAIALSAASIWGFLEAADFVPHLDAYWIAVVWFVGLFVGALVNRIEHGTWGAA